MRYELRLNAYDALDHVVWTLALYGPDLPGSISTERLLWRGENYQGTGEPDPLKWAEDVLVAALESL